MCALYLAWCSSARTPDWSDDGVLAERCQLVLFTGAAAGTDSGVPGTPPAMANGSSRKRSRLDYSGRR